MSETSLSGKVVAVTGAGRGIGREIALLCARHGAAMVVNDYGGEGNDAANPAHEVVAFTATQKNDSGFAALFRFVINPLFLFSGTFFPVDRLPDAIEFVAAMTPLYHGVALIRGLILQTPELANWPVHLGYLVIFLAGAFVLAYRLLLRRLVQ